MRITNWTAAKTAGEKQYFTGVPCKYGHVTVRDVADRSCYQCKLDKAAKWKRENADKHAAANKEWTQRNPLAARRTQLRAKARNPKTYWASSAFQAARTRAANRNVPFTITREYLLSIVTDTCPVFNTPFNFIGNGRIVPTSPSVDRIVPDKGYVPGNVVVISQRANGIKQNANAQEIRKVADWLQRVTEGN